MPKKLVKKNLHMECQSEEGITLALLDGIFAIVEILVTRDLTHTDVQEALKDVFSNANWRYLSRASQELLGIKNTFRLLVNAYDCHTFFGYTAPVGEMFCEKKATVATTYNDGTIKVYCDEHFVSEQMFYFKQLIEKARK